MQVLHKTNNLVITLLEDGTLNIVQEYNMAKDSQQVIILQPYEYKAIKELKS